MRKAALLAAGLLASCGTEPAVDPTAAANVSDVAEDEGRPRTARRANRAGQYLRADADGDGVVTRAEIEREATAHFARLDANRDGTYSREELGRRSNAERRRDRGLIPRAPFTRDDLVARALARFDRRDRNDDGRLEGTELQARVRRAMADREARGSR